ncbi:SDR family oxidoreductase [Pelomyxa schiedti]|nr:SDR family oxidoreductase [Pelomyxa schiedti]
MPLGAGIEFVRLALVFRSLSWMWMPPNVTSAARLAASQTYGEGTVAAATEHELLPCYWGMLWVNLGLLVLIILSRPRQFAGSKTLSLLPPFLIVTVATVFGTIIKPSGYAWITPGFGSSWGSLTWQPTYGAVDATVYCIFNAALGGVTLTLVLFFNELYETNMLIFSIFVREAFSIMYYTESRTALVSEICIIIAVLSKKTLDKRLLFISPSKYSDRVVLVTGAASGMGKEIAMQYAKGGAKLILFDVGDTSHVEEACLSFGHPHGSLLAIRGNVLSASDCSNAADAAQKKFGPINTLVHAAGVIGKTKTFMESEIDEMMTIMDVNYRGSLMITKAFLPQLTFHKSSRILAFSSCVSQTGSVGMSGYVASKSAVLGFFDSLKMEIEYLGCMVTVVCPWYVDTNLFNNSGSSWHRGLMYTPDYVAARARIASDRGLPRLFVAPIMALFTFYTHLRFLLPDVHDTLSALIARRFTAGPANSTTATVTPPTAGH